jgi:dephospho-CoA kinase
VKAILVTGMSGTGKSSALEHLAALGYDTIDTDSDEWSEWVTLADGTRDWVWRESAIAALLASDRPRTLYVAGCKSNQGRFHSRFDDVVLLSAPVDVMLERIATRSTNRFGQDPSELAKILDDLAAVEPLLRRTATVEIDTSVPLTDVVARLAELGDH